MGATGVEVAEIAVEVARRGQDLEAATARLIRAVGFRRQGIETGLDVCRRQRLLRPSERAVYDRAVEVLEAALGTGLFRG